jgi:hypothetical protein
MSFVLSIGQVGLGVVMWRNAKTAAAIQEVRSVYFIPYNSGARR